MKGHIRKIGIVGLCVAIVSSLGISSAAAGEDTASGSRNSWGVIVNGEYTSAAEIDAMFPEVDDEAVEGEQMTPFLLDPVDLVACNTLNQTNLEIRRIEDVKNWSSSTGGSISLTCGDSKFGYRHIRDGHEADWRGVLAKVGDTGSNWDDFMFFAAIESLVTPDRIVDKGAGNLCYTAPITLLNYDMVPVYQFYPTIIIGQNTRHVVTAYPGDRC